MAGFIDRIRGWFGGGRVPLDDSQIQALRTEFKARFHNFKLLLSANGRVLETMAALETAWAGSEPFDMYFVWAGATELAVTVARIVQHLDEIGAGRYGALKTRFREIQAEIAGVLAPPPITAGARVCIPIGELGRDQAGSVGSKMANLGEAAHLLGLPARATAISRRASTPTSAPTSSPARRWSWPTPSPGRC